MMQQVSFGFLRFSTAGDGLRAVDLGTVVQNEALLFGGERGTSTCYSKLEWPVIFGPRERTCLNARGPLACTRCSDVSLFNGCTFSGDAHVFQAPVTTIRTR